MGLGPALSAWPIHSPSLTARPLTARPRPLPQSPAVRRGSARATPGVDRWGWASIKTSRPRFPDRSARAPTEYTGRPSLGPPSSPSNIRRRHPCDLSRSLCCSLDFSCARTVMPPAAGKKLTRSIAVKWTSAYAGSCTACGFEHSCDACARIASCSACTARGCGGSCRNVHSKAHRAAGIQRSAGMPPSSSGASSSSRAWCTMREAALSPGVLPPVLGTEACGHALLVWRWGPAARLVRSKSAMGRYMSV